MTAKTTIDLLPLPFPDVSVEDGRDQYGYVTYTRAFDENQMQDYARDNVEADRAQRQAEQNHIGGINDMVAPPAGQGNQHALQRYEPERYDEDRVRMEPCEDGDYVRFSDVQALTQLAAPPAVPVPEGREPLAWKWEHIDTDGKQLNCGLSVTRVEPTDNAFWEHRPEHRVATRVTALYAAPPAAPVPVDESLRLAVERTRDDLGPQGDNYPAVRRLLAFAEAHTKALYPA